MSIRDLKTRCKYLALFASAVALNAALPQNGFAAIVLNSVAVAYQEEASVPADYPFNRFIQNVGGVVSLAGRWSRDDGVFLPDGRKDPQNPLNYGSSHLTASVSKIGPTFGTFGVSAKLDAAGQNYGWGTTNLQMQFSFSVVGQPETITGNISSLASAKQVEGVVSQVPLTSGLNIVSADPSRYFSGAVWGSTVGSMNTLTLPIGNYFGWYGYGLNAGMNDCNAIQHSGDCVASAIRYIDYSLTFSNAVVGAGFDPLHPVMPVSVNSATHSANFVDAHSNQWFDPQVAGGYDFATTDGSHFTRITGLPAGFSLPFEVFYDGLSLGLFQSDSDVDFVALLGHGVSTFSIRGITPGVDPNSVEAFPIALAFDREGANFSMTAVDIIDSAGVPEPGSFALVTVALFALLSRSRILRSDSLRNFPSALKNLYQQVC